MTLTAPAAAPPAQERPAAPRRPVRPLRVLLHVFLGLVALGWLLPLALAVYASVRPYEETARLGYVSMPEHLTLDYYVQAWTQAELPRYYLNTLIIVVPGVVVTLFLASFTAFAIARLRVPGRKVLLIVFTAGNLLPPQVLITPLYTFYTLVPLPEWLSDSQSLYDSYLGLILIHVAFQFGFCVFVMANFMRTIPEEITEAALVDGAGVWKRYWRLTLPLCRPVLAALSTLQFTWMYNDFLWALVLMSSGDKLPVTSALNNLRGQFFTDYNLLAAGSMLVALPTLIVFQLLHKQFVAGLTLGSTKG
ncbi:carbohydrate ABC transporter permease [Nonomuraea fuscirosea]|jgi:multiple sugar transport system permease protein|uniref:Multiple sugar transport system permease protein n=1 Tax=Nonomuraea fuscirosea TaxID=1291556 RepID=A0A2T0MUM3_9ACTN|nr:carbohydrate ABC transporter permease [Nonomuraea fuscirosea]PRX62521.1 multiple sugar transport system permease protein [Nonomuraea fuscirosea]WSA48099.1 carbohydrate ABC transporter permease [Nonomuraea fuscirosea]